MKKKILLIEDDDAIRQLYKRQLELAELATDAFATGTEGLAALKKNPYDLFLLDIMLPDINGIDVLKAAKADQEARKVPVVILTNLGQDSIIKEGFALGAVAYFIKASYTPSQLVQEVKNILEGKQPTNPAPLEQT